MESNRLADTGTATTGPADSSATGSAQASATGSAQAAAAGAAQSAATGAAQSAATGAAQSATTVSAPDDRVLVHIEHDHYRTDISVRGHELVSDEPFTLGGADLGPTPYELLAAALGSCTAMTLRMYADRKQLPLEAVTVWVKHEKRPSGSPGHRDVFHTQIELAGELGEHDRRRLLEIAERCPVHRTLKDGAELLTELTGNGN